MRVVLDTNILVRAAGRARGPARDVLQTITASPRHTLLTSPFLLRELERVLSYGRVQVMTRFTDDDIAQYMSYLQTPGITEIVFPGPAPRVVPSDPDDDAVVHTAIAGQANALCTLNRHFFHAAVLQYCHQRGVIVVSDVDLLKLLRAQASSL
ncbi:MAG TPA: putative toxin-antitoxin system toxin component, PIN family [Bryobacteraceae bacterium]